MPRHEPGRDDLWDRLGDGWQAVEGVQPDMRLYVHWDKAGDGRPKISGLCITGPSITADALRSIPVGRLVNLATAAEGSMSRDEFLSDLDPLRRSKGIDPDEFADRVAYYYRIFTGLSPRPAKEIAEHSGVPVATVRGWIREARLRGKLPPGTRGKAG